HASYSHSQRQAVGPGRPWRQTANAMRQGPTYKYAASPAPQAPSITPPSFPQKTSNTTLALNIIKTNPSKCRLGTTAKTEVLELAEETITTLDIIIQTAVQTETTILLVIFTLVVIHTDLIITTIV